MGMLYTAEICIFFFQFHDCCIDRHSAAYVSQNLCRNQKQTDTERYQTDSEKEYLETRNNYNIIALPISNLNQKIHRIEI